MPIAFWTPRLTNRVLRMKTTICAVDFSNLSDLALNVAVQLAAALKTRLLILHVAPFAEQIGESELNLTYKMFLEECEEKLRALDIPDQVEAEYRVVVGKSPAGLILGEAAKEHADQIVIGSHGRTGLGRLLLGSVAENVLRGAACPVVVVKDVHMLEDAD